MAETKTGIESPPPPTTLTVAADYDGHIRELGDRIMALTPAQARELWSYIVRVEGPKNIPGWREENRQHGE